MGSNASRNTVILTALSVVSALLYIVLCTHVPVAISPAAIHDDGSYIDGGRNIASGLWLGRYCQYTLMKGPGYPLFLAAAALSGLNVVTAQAILYSLSVYLLAFLTLRLFRSLLLSCAVFEAALWNFGADTDRIMREGIYQSQFLVCFSLILLAFLTAGWRRYSLLAVSALFFGWMWITREEGVTLVPVFALLFIYFSWRVHWSAAGLRRFLVPVALFSCLAAVPALTVSAINSRVYQTFAVVDIKGSFQHALEALESINASDKLPLVPISRDVREQAYKVSPAFASLRELFDDPGSPAIRPWKEFGCGVRPKTCGDFVLGWFMWALRDAAFIEGHYTNTADTSSFYRRISVEIDRACRSGSLGCSNSRLPFLPTPGLAFVRSIPRSSASLLLKLLFIKPPFAIEPVSFGTAKQVVQASQFLHVQNFSPPYDVKSSFPHSGPVWAAIKCKAFLIALSRILVPALLLSGFAAFLFSLWNCVSARCLNAATFVTFVAWVAVALRILLLAIIDVTSFPASYHQYISYAFPLSCFAALTSLTLATRRLLGSRMDRRMAVSAAARKPF